METEKLNGEIKKGLLVLSVLQVISGKKVFVGDILKTLAVTDFATQEGTLYPLLSRLKRDNYITYEWVESPNGPPRKYYELSETERGMFAGFPLPGRKLGKESAFKRSRDAARNAIAHLVGINITPGALDPILDPGREMYTADELREETPPAETGQTEQRSTD